MIKAGIVDPTKVTRSALQNAASVSSLFLSTEAVVADVSKDEPMQPQMPNDVKIIAKTNNLNNWL